MGHSTLPGSSQGPESKPAMNDMTDSSNEEFHSGRRQLRRSRENRVIGGVGGGLGRYFGIDPVLFRIGFLALLVPGGFGLLLYIISWIAIPEFRSVDDEVQDSARSPVSQRMSGMIVGGALVLIGFMILLERFIDWFDPRVMGGAALIIVGAFVVWRGMQSEART